MIFRLLAPATLALLLSFPAWADGDGGAGQAGADGAGTTDGTDTGTADGGTADADGDGTGTADGGTAGADGDGTGTADGGTAGADGDGTAGAGGGSGYQTGTESPTLPYGSGPGGAAPTTTPPLGGTAALPGAATATGMAGLPPVTRPSMQLLGLTVRDAGGAEVGRIQQLIVNPQTGQVTHAVVSVDGMPAGGSKWVALPWQRLRIGETAATVDVPRQQIVQAPEFPPETAALPGAR